MEKLKTSSINSEGRIRQDLGDIDALCNSIKEHGLIQPIVIERNSLTLVAGGRRLTALRRLQLDALTHAVHFIWRDEEDSLRRTAAELEENLRRKELTWPEQIEGKRRLLETLQAIHGKVLPGNQPTISAKLQGVNPNAFGVVKLAAVLGEDPSTTSRDLTLAEAVKSMPVLTKADTKGGAMRKLQMFNTVVGMAVASKKRQEQSQKPQVEGQPAPALPAKQWTIHEGDFRANISSLRTESVDFIHTDLPYGSSVEKMSSHASPLGFDDSRSVAVSLLRDLAFESYRILRPDRYACYWFGFNYYQELVDTLRSVGFSVVPVPVIWVKNTKSGENPNTRYSNSYEPLLVAIKGRPMLMRPGAANVKTFPTVPPKDKLHVAEKPVALVYDIIKDLCAPRGLIVDLCAGTGSTGVAALQHKCETVLFELNPGFCKIMKSRLEVL